MKKCPFCAEEIQDAAILCRYCHADLSPKASTPGTPSGQPSPHADDRGQKKMDVPQIIMVASLVIAVGYILLRMVYISERRRVHVTDPLVHAAQVLEEQTHSPANSPVPPPDPRVAQTMPTEADKEKALKALTLLLNDHAKASRRDQVAPDQAVPETAGSQQHNLSALNAFMHGNYETAQGEWKATLAADPDNADAQAGLERLRKMTGQ